jgi:hypothetical protein
MQTPTDAQMNTNARHQYMRTAVSDQQLQRQIALAKLSSPLGYIITSSQRQVPTSSHMNYISPVSSSLYINTLKANAVGKTAYKVGLSDDALTGTKCYYPSGARSSIRRARSGGCVAPKKKGAIQNVNLSNGQVCAFVRQNY